MLTAQRSTLIDGGSSTDPRLNLALEEFVFRNFTEGEYLLLYVNAPSVILGKHQNMLEEVDPGFAEGQGIPVVRRISGGGAVYHDTGNLNFSVITAHDPAKHNNYESFVAPVIRALRLLGVEARLNSRNSLVAADGRKISGNAQFTSRGRMLSHGTLLFNSDLDALNAVLQPVVGEIESHAVQSVRSRVVNIGELLPEPMTMEDFRDHIARVCTGTEPGEEIPQRRLTEEEWRKVQRLAEEKYGSWEWNIGRSPKFTVGHRIGGGPEGGEHLVRLRVADGIIEGVELASTESDPSLSDVLSGLPGRRYEPSKIRSLLSALFAESTLPGSPEHIINRNT